MSDCFGLFITFSSQKKVNRSHEQKDKSNHPHVSSFSSQFKVFRWNGVMIFWLRWVVPHICNMKVLQNTNFVIQGLHMEMSFQHCLVQ